MSNPLHVATVQFSPEFGKFEDNLTRLQALLEPVEADIIILPELCLTGYFFISREEAFAAAEATFEPTLAWLRTLAAAKNALVCCGVAEPTPLGDVFNASVLVVPETDELYIYRKIHLFYKEKYSFLQGDIPFFTIRNEQRDITIGMMICYDWRFPESARVLSLQGADLIVCPSNLVTDVWHLVMPARSIENKVYLAVANRAGSEVRGDETLIFKGKSALYAYNGTALCTADEHSDAVLYADIYPEKTRDKSFNAENALFSDRRPEMYAPLLHEANPKATFPKSKSQ